MIERVLAVAAAAALALACEAPAGVSLLEPETEPGFARGAPPPPSLTWTMECPGCASNGVFGSSGADVYAVGTQAGNPAVFHYDGTTWSAPWVWTPSDPDFPFSPPLLGAWVGPDRSLYTSQLIGPDVYRFLGTGWEVAHPIGFFSFGLGGTSEYLFVTGEFGTISRFDGTTWTSWWHLGSAPTYAGMDNPDDVFGAWGTGDQVFAVGATFLANLPCGSGGHGSVIQYDGTSWTTWISSDDEAIPPMAGVWGASPTDVFAVGAGGTILHFDGAQWTPMTSGTNANLCAVWGTSGSNVFAVGAAGTILHFNGASWSPMDSGTNALLRAIWGAPRGDVFIATSAGVLHGAPARPAAAVAGVVSP